MKNIKNIIILVLSFLVIVMGGFIIYAKMNINVPIDKDELNNNQNNNNEINTEVNNNEINTEVNNNNNNTLYSIVQTDSIGVLDSNSYSGNVEVVDNNGNIKFFYPQINLEGTEIEKLNKEIMDNVNSAITSINNTVSNDSSTGYKITLANKDIYLIHLNYYRYEISENASNIIIKKYKVALTEWATGLDYIETKYIINKKDNSVKKENFEAPTIIG